MLLLSSVKIYIKDKARLAAKVDLSELVHYAHVDLNGIGYHVCNV